MKNLLTILMIAILSLTININQAQTKKDGTPDKRYKTNQVKQDTTKHKKKDGTADMRYKENKGMKKDTIKHKKADGTADKRYKESKPVKP